MNTEITETTSGWILYDGDCALCRRWVARGYRILRRRGFKFAALQAPWVQSRFGLKPEDLMLEMRLVPPDGRMLGGADALVEIARSIWWAWPIYLLGRLPGVMPVLRVAYRRLARRRHCSGGACGLPRHNDDHRPKRSVTSSFYELP